MTTHFKLTERQIEAIKFAATGLVYKEIAQEMKISYRTVTVLIDQSIQRSGCKNCVELVYKLSKAEII
jgi:DNA-binding NarL/FixJ family response regulator